MVKGVCRTHNVRERSSSLICQVWCWRVSVSTKNESTQGTSTKKGRSLSHYGGNASNLRVEKFRGEVDIAKSLHWQIARICSRIMRERPCGDGGEVSADVASSKEGEGEGLVGKRKFRCLILCFICCSVGHKIYIDDSRQDNMVYSVSRRVGVVLCYTVPFC